MVMAIPSNACISGSMPEISFRKLSMASAEWHGRRSAVIQPEKFHWRLVASTYFHNEPFGEYVEGLSYCGTKSCVFEYTVR